MHLNISFLNMHVSKLCCDPPGDLVWFSVGPQWEETYSVLGESETHQGSVWTISGAMMIPITVVHKQLESFSSDLKEQSTLQHTITFRPRVSHWSWCGCVRNMNIPATLPLYLERIWTGHINKRNILMQDNKMIINSKTMWLKNMIN